MIKQTCKRCGAEFECDTTEDVCGNCADDLRDQQNEIDYQNDELFRLACEGKT